MYFCQVSRGLVRARRRPFRSHRGCTCPGPRRAWRHRVCQGYRTARSSGHLRLSPGGACRTIEGLLGRRFARRCRPRKARTLVFQGQEEKHKSKTNGACRHIRSRSTCLDDTWYRFVRDCRNTSPFRIAEKTRPPIYPNRLRGSGKASPAVLSSACVRASTTPLAARLS